MDGQRHSKRQRLHQAHTQEAASLEALLFNEHQGDDVGNERAAHLGQPTHAAQEPLAPQAPRPFVDGAAAQPPAPAWVDPSDAAVTVNVARNTRLRKLRQAEGEVVLPGQQLERRLRNQHGDVHSSTAWARRGRGVGTDPGSGSDTEQDGDGLLKRSTGLLDGSCLLPPGQLEVSRLRDANHTEPCQSVVSSLAFHPNGQLLLVAGLDRHLRFFDVDGVTNPRVQSTFLEDLPIHKAAFVMGGRQVLATGRRSHYYVVDLEAAKVERVAGSSGREGRSLEAFAVSPTSPVVAMFGRDGHVPLVSLASRQTVGTLKMNGTARAGAFSANDIELLTCGGDGAVCVWDLRMRRCLGRYLDSGSTGGTVLACSPSDTAFACGSKSGVVNVYQRPAQWQAEARAGSGGPLAAHMLTPQRSLPHLTTSVDSLAFNHDGQILAMASRLKRDSLRLVHLPTLTAFANFPTSRSPLHYVHSLAFSPSGAYLAVGNAKGRVLLYHMHHY